LYVTSLNKTEKSFAARSLSKTGKLEPVVVEAMAVTQAAFFSKDLGFNISFWKEMRFK
jgi:hypothetical protein